MKNDNLNFGYQPKPIHKMVSLEPYFDEEQWSMIEDHFSYWGFSYENDDIEDWDWFEMDYEGQMVQ